MISLKQLTYAVAVGKHRHFKKAADACSVSQSALSSAISELESQLGVQVFERDNKKVIVTPLGDEFLGRAARVLVEVEDLQQLAQKTRSPLSYPLSMGVIPTIGPYLLPKVLPAVREQYPDLQLSIVENQSHVLVEQVRSGALDMAVLALPYQLEGLLAFEFWQEDFYSVFHHSHRLSHQAEVTSDELEQTHLLLLQDGHCLKDHALAVCHFEQKQMDLSLSGTSLYTLVQMVAGRMGATLIPAMSLDQLVGQNPELRALHVNEPGPHRRLAFICRPNYTGVKNIELLKKLFRAQLQLSCPEKQIDSFR